MPDYDVRVASVENGEERVHRVIGASNPEHARQVAATEGWLAGKAVPATGGVEPAQTLRVGLMKDKTPPASRAEKAHIFARAIDDAKAAAAAGKIAQSPLLLRPVRTIAYGIVLAWFLLALISFGLFLLFLFLTVVVGALVGSRL